MSYLNNVKNIDVTNASNIDTGTLSNNRLSAFVTLQGNTFNGASQLVQLDGSSKLPAVDGSQLTALNASAIASGTISNSQTTATSANTASTIVLRDGSGNFSAGTITAALSGNASSATTATNLSGGAANSLPNQSASNTTQMLATTNSAVLCTNASGILGWQTQLPIVNISTAIFFQQGRLTDTSATPNGGNSSSGSATLFFTPSYQGNTITLYNTTSSTWITQTFSEISTSMAITAGNYDVYIASASSTTVTMSLLAWTNDTTPPTRGSQNGRLVKNGAADNLLVGIIRTDGAKTYSWLGSRWIINFYNVINLPLMAAQTSAASYTFSGSTSIVAANSNTTDGVGRFSALFDIAINQSINLENYQSIASVSGAANGNAYQLGIAVDATSTNKSYSAIALQVSNGLIGSINNLPNTGACKYASTGLTGYHFFQRTESLSASGPTVTLTLANATFGQGGLMTGNILG